MYNYTKENLIKVSKDKLKPGMLAFSDGINFFVCASGYDEQVASVTLGQIVSDGKFQSLSFNGNEASNSGDPETVEEYYTYNGVLPVPECGSGGGESGGSCDFYRCASVNIEEKTWDGYKAVLTDGVYSFEDTVTGGLSYGSAFVPEIGNIYNSDASIIAATLWKGFADYIFYTPLSTESVVAETGQTLETIGGTIDYSNHTALFSSGTYIQSDVSIEFPLTVTFKLKQLTDSNSGIFCFGETKSDLLGIAFSSSHKYVVVQQVNNSTQIENFSAEIIPDSVNFVQFALVCNGNIVQLYRAGEKILEATNLLSETYNKLRINDMCNLWSYGPNQNEYLDLRIYSRVLSAGEIAQLSNA